MRANIDTFIYHHTIYHAMYEGIMINWQFATWSHLICDPIFQMKRYSQVWFKWFRSSIDFIVLYSHNVAMSLKRLNRCKILDREMNSLSSKSELLIQMSLSINKEQAGSVCTLHEFICGDHKRTVRLILLAQCILHTSTWIYQSCMPLLRTIWTPAFFIFYFLCVQIKVEVSLVQGTHKDIHYAAVCIIIIILKHDMH